MLRLCTTRSRCDLPFDHASALGSGLRTTHGGCVRAVTAPLRRRDGAFENPKALPTRRQNKGHNILYWYHLRRSWFLQIRDFLFKIHARIAIPKVWVPKLVRENDVNLTNAFQQRMHLSERRLA